MNHIEHNEQKTLIQWRDTHKVRYPDLGMLVAYPAGGKRTMVQNKRTGAWYCAEGKRLKDEGVAKGFPDLVLFVASQGYSGLTMEMKAPGKKLRPDQVEWLERLEARGYKATWADNWTIAAGIIVDYLGLPEGVKP
jgi:hypothetical protein